MTLWCWLSEGLLYSYLVLLQTCKHSLTPLSSLRRKMLKMKDDCNTNGSLLSNENVYIPEDPICVPPMAADFFPEAGAVTDVFERQLPLLKPRVLVESTERLL